MTAWRASHNHIYLSIGSELVTFMVSSTTIAVIAPTVITPTGH